MAGEELQVVRLKDDFYRDGFYKILLALLTILVAITFLVLLSVSLFLAKPAPVNFRVDNDFRILPNVPVDQEYISQPDLIQWISQTLPIVFTFDFVSYTKQLKNAAQYFTSNGWSKYLDQINVYVNFNSVQDQKIFVNSYAAGAPFVLNQGVLSGKYAWWIQMPINVHYITVDRHSIQPLVIQALIVRVPTLNNLYGVGIENIIVSKGNGEQIHITGFSNV